MSPMRHPAPLIHDYLSDSARRVPDKVALVCQKQRLTYGEIEERANALAHALTAMGVERGDRVLVFSDPTPDAAMAFWAITKANAVVSVVNAQVKADKLAYLLADSQAAALVVDARLAPIAAVAAARAPHLRAVVVCGRSDARVCQVLPNAVPLAEAVDGQPRSHPPARTAIDVDLASIIYTSGSTGEPKGVMLTHRNMLTAATSVSAYLELTEDDVVLSVLPLSFNYGLYQMILAFRTGARLVLERSFAYPAEILRRLAEERVTAFPGVPTIFAMLAEAEAPEEYDVSCVRFVTNTAAALSEKHIAMLRRLFPRARIYSMYGLTECKRCTYLPPEDLDRKPTSVGVAIPNTEMWIVDDEDRRVPAGEVGQLVVRGATVMRGYWGKPEETAKRLRPGPLPGELVLYTGDLCRFDEEGYLYFVGRMDDIIKSRGEKIAPKEVELAITSIPGVKEVAVVGVRDELLGQAVKAFVVLDRGSRLGTREIELECRARLESFMVPKYVEILDELPKTTTGKINKKGLAGAISAKTSI